MKSLSGLALALLFVSSSWAGPWNTKQILDGLSDVGKIGENDMHTYACERRAGALAAVDYLHQFLVTIDSVLLDKNGDAYKLASGDRERFLLPIAWSEHPDLFYQQFYALAYGAYYKKSFQIGPFNDPLPVILAAYIILHPNATHAERSRAWEYMKVASYGPEFVLRFGNN